MVGHKDTVFAVHNRTYKGSTYLYPMNLRCASSNPKSTKGHGFKMKASISKLSEPAISWEIFYK